MTVRIISPAGVVDPAIVQGGADTLRSRGFDVEIASHALDRAGRYAGTVADRLQDLARAVEDPAVDVIWCSRGGYGCMHLLDKLPASLIRANVKWLVGFSDVTALHALWQRAGVPSLHAPMMRQLATAPQHPATTALLDFLLQNPRPHSGIVPPVWPVSPCPDNLCGTASGRMVGGNLAVLSALHGTPYDFRYDDTILFVEDIGESPYKVDRMVQTLRLGGMLGQIRGLVVGQFTDAGDDETAQAAIRAIIRRVVEPYGIPVLFDAPIGHVEDNRPVVEGGTYRIEISDTMVKIAHSTV